MAQKKRSREFKVSYDWTARLKTKLHSEPTAYDWMYEEKVKKLSHEQKRELNILPREILEECRKGAISEKAAFQLFHRCEGKTLIAIGTSLTCNGDAVRFQDATLLPSDERLGWSWLLASGFCGNVVQAFVAPEGDKSTSFEVRGIRLEPQRTVIFPAGRGLRKSHELKNIRKFRSLWNQLAGLKPGKSSGYSRGTSAPVCDVLPDLRKGELRRDFQEVFGALGGGMDPNEGRSDITRFNELLRATDTDPASSVTKHVLPAARDASVLAYPCKEVDLLIGHSPSKASDSRSPLTSAATNDHMVTSVCGHILDEHAGNISTGAARRLAVRQLASDDAADLGKYDAYRDDLVFTNFPIGAQVRVKICEDKTKKSATTSRDGIIKSNRRDGREVNAAADANSSLAADAGLYTVQLEAADGKEDRVVHEEDITLLSPGCPLLCEADDSSSEEEIDLFKLAR